MFQKMNTPQELIDAIKKGEMVLVVDEEERENEGDFFALAESITPEQVNFMITHGRGLLCVALSSDICDQLNLPLSPRRGVDPLGTAFTLSLDAVGVGTGISASDRAHSIQALANVNSTQNSLLIPGHIFPVKEAKGGLSSRRGHTEAAVALARAAKKREACAIVEVLNEKGEAANRKELFAIAKEHQLKIGSVVELYNALR